MICLMDSSPGLFNGDVQEIGCKVGAGAKVYLTNQSSCKLHPSPHAGKSKQIQQFTIDKGGILSYFPEPIIPMDQANFESITEIHLSSGGKAFVGEIITPGRIGYGESFAYSRIRSKLSVYWEGEWTTWDSYCFEPSRDDVYGAFRDYTHMGTLWVLAENIDQGDMDRLVATFEEMEKKNMYAGASFLEKNGVVVRFLGHSSCGIKNAMDKCQRIFNS